MNRATIFIFPLLFFTNISFSQVSTEFSYSLGNSVLLYDLESSSKLSHRIGLSISKSRLLLEGGYQKMNHQFNGDLNILDDINKNYQSEVDLLFVSFKRKSTLVVDKLFIKIGLDFGVGFHNNYGNLKNRAGISYSDLFIDSFDSPIYSSDRDFETDLESYNIDNLEDYNTTFYHLGPSVSLSYKVADNLSLYLTSIYRKNSTDLLDNVNSKNIRGIETNVNNDDHLDFFVGLSFHLNHNKKQEKNIQEKIEELVFQDTLMPKEQQVNVENITFNKEEYILNFFDVEDNDEVIEDSFDEDIYIEEPIEEEVEKSIDQLTLNSQKQAAYYLVVGVFQDVNNAQQMAFQLNIEPDNIIFRNELHYLYAMTSLELKEVRQLRENINYDSWILTVTN